MGALIQATHTRHPVKEPEDVGHVRRIAAKLSRNVGANDAEAGRAELAVSELATNLLRHAEPGGFILVRSLAASSSRGIEFLSVDSGPGMRDASAYINRGSSKPGGVGAAPKSDAEKAWPGSRTGLGVGLASVQRLSTHFDLHSAPREGTVVLSRHFFGDVPKAGAFDVGGVSVARPGESVSGDAWAIAESHSPFSVLLVDGLGHGPNAYKAAEAAIGALDYQYAGDVEDYVRRANVAMMPTRGGVLGLAHIDPAQERVQFVGIGNIEGRIFFPDRAVSLTSQNGTVGVDMHPPAARILVRPWGPRATMILHSDGVRLKVDPAERPELFRHDPAIIAAVALRDGFRGTDDATVVVVKDAREAAP